MASVMLEDLSRAYLRFRALSLVCECLKFLYLSLFDVTF
jgi:hypothetical protein